MYIYIQKGENSYPSLQRAQPRTGSKNTHTHRDGTRWYCYSEFHALMSDPQADRITKPSTLQATIRYKTCKE